VHLMESKTACCPQHGLRSWPTAAAGPSVLAIFAAAASVVVHLVRLHPLEDEETFVHRLLLHGSSHPGPPAAPGFYSKAAINNIPAAVLFRQAHLLRRFFAACLRWPAAWPSQSSLLALTGRQVPPIAHASSTSAAELRSASRPNWFLISQLSGSLCILHQLRLGLFSALAIIGGQA